ncbi:MAG: hypothetical protein F2667_00185 [Actinobacteria bacterium]|uniref:Unannotated protein n=1 Tax=freshwater metagenome TaxID=449393 RepID=A0A6J6ND90_9ZZZZ|nr:hypothetical protein [Actinomycetota bacterium]
MTSRTAAALLTATVLLLGASGCGSDDATESGSSSSPSSDTSAGESTDGVEATEETSAPAPASADPVLVDDPGTPDATLTLDDVGFDLEGASIPVGGIVRFTSTDGGPHGIVVGTLSSVTVMGGLDEWYRFDEPGSYVVSDEITGATATVVVE